MKPNPANKCCQIPDCHYGSVIPVNQPLLDTSFLTPDALSPEPTAYDHEIFLNPPVIAAEMSNTQPVIAVPRIPQASSLSSPDLTGAFSSEPSVFESFRITDTRFSSLDLMNNAPGEKVLKESFNKRVRNRFISDSSHLVGTGLGYTAPGVDASPETFKGGIKPGAYELPNIALAV